MTTERFCASCAHFDSDTMQCQHEHGLLKGIEQSEAMSAAPHSCRSYKEVVYKASPALLMQFVLEDHDIEVDFTTAKSIFDNLMKKMEDKGYISKS